MSRVYRRGSRWYIDCLDHQGERVRRSAGKTKQEAEQVLKEVTQGVELVSQGATPLAAVTLRDLSGPWLERRRRKGLKGVGNELGYLNRHILPSLGDLPADSIRVKHVRAFVEELEGKGLAPRTVRHIYSSLRKLFADLVVEERVASTPCVLTRDYLPPAIDADPEWRAQAVFTRSEVEHLLGSPIPEERRVLYATLFLTGMRLGELIGLRWRDVDFAPKPLGRIAVHRSYGGRTKTKIPRAVPIHPLLSTLLEGWRRAGVGHILGRMPAPDDLVFPSPKTGGMRDNNAIRRVFHRDLERQGLRKRRIHDTRRTFVTLSRASGARADILKMLTHTSSRDILDIYTSLPWETLCGAVSCIELRVDGVGLGEVGG